MGASKDVFGGNGYDELTSASGATSGEWYAIKAVNNASATVNITNRQGDDSSGLVVASTDIVYVTATNIEVTDGTIHAYIQG